MHARPLNLVREQDGTVEPAGEQHNGFHVHNI
jgi:hypothetical protein